MPEHLIRSERRREAVRPRGPMLVAPGLAVAGALYLVAAGQHFDVNALTATALGAAGLLQLAGAHARPARATSRDEIGDQDDFGASGAGPRQPHPSKPGTEPQLTMALPGPRWVRAALVMKKYPRMVVRTTSSSSSSEISSRESYWYMTAALLTRMSKPPSSRSARRPAGRTRNRSVSAADESSPPRCSSRSTSHASGTTNSGRCAKRRSWADRSSQEVDAMPDHRIHRFTRSVRGTSEEVVRCTPN
jgi:hypothetical protein